MSGKIQKRTRGHHPTEPPAGVTDLITMASILRIPVCMHDVPEEDIFRPVVWNAFVADNEGQDYRACAAYGPMYMRV